MAYERRVTDLIGLGGTIERAGGEIDTNSVIGEVFFHPHAGWRFAAGAGVEFPDDEDNEFLARAGAAYEFEIKRFSIAPEFNLDFVDGETVKVYGVTFGYGF